MMGRYLHGNFRGLGAERRHSATGPAYVGLLRAPLSDIERSTSSPDKLPIAAVQYLIHFDS